MSVEVSFVIRFTTSRNVIIVIDVIIDKKIGQNMMIVEPKTLPAMLIGYLSP